jgi:hypothetical protein
LVKIANAYKFLKIFLKDCCKENTAKQVKNVKNGKNVGTFWEAACEYLLVVVPCL